MSNAGLKLLAIDLGAESGRAILGEFDGERITLSDVAISTPSPGRSPGLNKNHGAQAQPWQSVLSKQRD